jgi:hypothetical protein
MNRPALDLSPSDVLEALSALRQGLPQGETSLLFPS